MYHSVMTAPSSGWMFDQARKAAARLLPVILAPAARMSSVVSLPPPATNPPEARGYTASSGGNHRFPVHVLENRDNRVQYAIASCQGFRPGMEDAHVVVLNLEGQGAPEHATSLFGVFDGHAGKEVAAFCAQHLPTQVLRSPSFAKGHLRAALTEAFMAVDELIKDPQNQTELYAVKHDIPVPPAPQPAEAAMRAGTAEEPAGPGQSDAYSVARGEEVRSAMPRGVHKVAHKYGYFSSNGEYQGPRAGSTAVVALLQHGKLAVGHVGDSRCVLSRGGEAVLLTKDHKPDTPEEYQRIYEAGETVESRAPGAAPRVAGSLAMSRAMGDVKFKDNANKPPEEQAVTALPDTKTAHITQENDFMVIACDGVWDVMTPHQVVHLIRHELKKGSRLGHIVQKVISSCLNSPHGPSMDNMTCMLVLFNDQVKDT